MGCFLLIQDSNFVLSLVTFSGLVFDGSVFVSRENEKGNLVFVYLNFNALLAWFLFVWLWIHS